MPEPMDSNRNKLKERIGPGFWIDQNDHLHVSLPEMCEACGLPPSEENMQIAKQAVMEMMLKRDPNVDFIDRRTPTD